MDFDKSKNSEDIGMVAGYFTAYAMFTIGLYFVLTFFNKLPKNWMYVHVMIITAIVAAIGILVKEKLK